ncbi:MAG: DUF3846 domain-containing protein [Pygmaiobacter massiliensis]|nr:DUF3846 domain-containing protein [Pygmaiobacter massiliensis]
MQNTIKVLKVETGRQPYEKTVGNDLKSLQTEVEGLIEVLCLPDGCLLVCNEEGKVNNMPPNRWAEGDIICGPFFVCADSDEGEFVSMTDQQIQDYKKQFSKIPTFAGDESQLEPTINVMEFGL